MHQTQRPHPYPEGTGKSVPGGSFVLGSTWQRRAPSEKQTMEQVQLLIITVTWLCVLEFC